MEASRSQSGVNKSTGALLADSATGVYAVRLLSFVALRESISVPARVCRIVVSQRADPEIVGSLRASLSSVSPWAVSAVVLPPSGWRGVLRNVPSRDGSAATEDEYDGVSHCVVVSLRSAAQARGRILVLAGLKYRGNIGTVVRSAVQSNAFRAIWIIRSEGDGASGAGGSKADRRGATDDELNYYSMQNAPLVPIRRFASAAEFLVAADADATAREARRRMVAVELGDRAVHLFSRAAAEVLRERDLYVVLGAEDVGTPAAILERCDALLEIPSLSASINVSCAFMAVLTTMQIADHDDRRRADAVANLL